MNVNRYLLTGYKDDKETTHTTTHTSTRTSSIDIQPSLDNVRRLVLAIGKEEMSGINNLTLPNKRNS